MAAGMTAGIADFLTVCSILSGFCVTVLMFRVQREIYVQEHFPQSDSWIALADYLIIASTLISLLVVVLPLVVVAQPSKSLMLFARASCATAVVLVAGYPLAILNHYGIMPGTSRLRYILPAVPGEQVIVGIFAILAGAAFILTILLPT